LDVRRINPREFPRDALRDFDRYQKVTDVYRLIDGRLQLVRIPFEESWSPERRLEKADEIRSGDYTVFCAYEDAHVVGEIMLVPTLDNGRMIVDSFHVSRECRRHGIGRALFETAKAEAKKKCARALYISACSARETIDFYFAMGCFISPNPIPAYALDEPCDLQLECLL